MFKLTKILNGRLNVPEVTKVKVLLEEDVYAGCVYYIEYSRIKSFHSTANPIVFIPLETVPYSDDGFVDISGFYPESNMVFEAEVGFTEDDLIEDEDGNWMEPEPFEIKCGDVLSFRESAHPNDSLRFELGEDAKVIDNVGYEDTRKLLVLLKW